MSELEEILLSRDELEAIKLKDFDGLDQIVAAERMEISQSTFQRILTSARKKMAETVVTGKALTIESEQKEYGGRQVRPMSKRGMINT
jgi:uncharacterized protein